MSQRKRCSCDGECLENLAEETVNSGFDEENNKRAVFPSSV